MTKEKTTSRNLTGILLTLIGLTSMCFAFSKGPFYFSKWGINTLLAASIGVLVFLTGILVYCWQWLDAIRFGRKTILVSTVILMILAGGFFYTVVYRAREQVPLLNTTNYFDLQAGGFLQGHTYLSVDPPQALKDLPDPYAHGAWDGIKVLYDTSYYQGKYYLYWGPIPALVACLFKLVGFPLVTDNFLTWLFVTGQMIFDVLILLLFWRSYKERLPGWVLWISSAVAILNYPLTWLLTRPDVYEVAIAAGQCFLMMGLYLALVNLQKAKPSNLLFALAGLSWGLAFNSRVNLIIIVIWFCLVVVWALWWNHNCMVGTVRNNIFSSLALMAPIFLCMTGQLVFNQIRFGNPLEYGARYQLDHISQVNVFNPRYIAPNAYNYLIRPVGLQASAPFLVEAELTRSSWPAWIHIPKGYVTREPVAGIFPTMPYSWFFLAAIAFCIFGIKDIKNRFKAQFDQHQFPNWIFILLAGGIFINFAIILCFQYAVFRYLSDVTPLLIIASSLGWWKLISLTKNHQEWCQFIILAGFLLAFISISLAVGLIYCPAVRW